jgi:hypothetical protein
MLYVQAPTLTPELQPHNEDISSPTGVSHFAHLRVLCKVLSQWYMQGT